MIIQLCRAQLFWLSRDESHFQFDRFHVTTGNSIHEVGAKPNDRINVAGIRLRRHETAINEQSFRGNRPGQLDPTSKTHRKATPPRCCGAKSERNLSFGCAVQPVREATVIDKRG